MTYDPTTHADNVPTPQRGPAPVITVTRRLTQNVEHRMTELFGARLSPDDLPFTHAALCDAARNSNVLVPTITDVIDAHVLGNANGALKLIANFGAGVDHIDLHAARALGIMVTNTPGVLTEDTADMTMALILSVPRRLGEGEKMIRAGAWDGWKPVGMLGHRVNGKTLGIIGMGRIGRAVAERARAFGLRIIYYNRHRLPAEIEHRLGATFAADIDALVSASDIITIHCPHTPETHHLLDERRLSLMQPHSYLINTARGEIVDENALIIALEGNRIAGAGLDVFVGEPRVDPRLLALSNTILIPHMGSATFEGRSAMGEKVMANIRAWYDGHRPPDLVLEGWV
jgi:glyoxylate reductase